MELVFQTSLAPSAPLIVFGRLAGARVGATAGGVVVEVSPVFLAIATAPRKRANDNCTLED